MVAKRSNSVSKSIAIAGATGDVGSYITEELLATNKSTVILLLRKDAPDLVAALKARYPEAASKLHTAVVTYSTSSLSSLTTVFEKHSIDTIIITISTLDVPALIECQESLLRAAESVTSVRRFVPVDWALGIGARSSFRPEIYAAKFAIVPSLDASKLNWMSFAHGSFMEYLAAGAPRVLDAAEGSTTHLKPFPWLIDVGSGAVDIAVGEDGKDGSTAWTRLSDIARYVVGACLLDNAEWDGKSARVAGWTGTFSELVEIIGSVTGKLVTRTPFSEIDASIDKPTPLETFIKELRVFLGQGGARWIDELGPILKAQGVGFTPKTVKDTLREAWTD